MINRVLIFVLCLFTVGIYAANLAQQRLQRINQSNTRLQTNLGTGQTNKANAQMQLLNERVNQRSALSRQPEANPSANRQAVQNHIHIQQTQQQIRDHH